MKLRSQLFLSSGALLTVALIGLLLGIFSVLHLTRIQSQAVSKNLASIDASIGMSQELNRQVTLLLAPEVDLVALRASVQRFDDWLTQARQHATLNSGHEALQQVAETYVQFTYLLTEPVLLQQQLLLSDEFSARFSHINQRVDSLLVHYLEQLRLSEQQGRERAWLITGLLSLVGLAVLVLGLVTAHSIAQRFGQPIEALAEAADLIGQGDFQVTLPVTGVAEMATLSRRFGLMAAALQQFRHSDVEALLAEQRRLQAVLDSIDDGLLIFDSAGQLEHFNPVAGRQLSCTAAHLGLQAGVVLQHPAVEQQLAQLAVTQSPANFMGDLPVQVQGESRLLSYSVTAMRHTGGQLLGMVMVLHDVTEQREFERIRSEFVLRASHELRTPMAGMHMAFGLLLERLNIAPESREADLLRIIDEGMQRLVLLITELLDFSRYQNGLQKLERQPCVATELLAQARERLLSQAAQQQVRLIIEWAPGIPVVQLDRLQIERVLDNLLSNAIRHSPPGSSVWLRASQQDQQLLLVVEDQGEGIPYAQQARVFEPFVQVGRSGGVGLGLALCREIVQLHGGQISVQSHPGRGARFALLLPLAAA